MTQHTELIERLRKGVEAMDDCSDGAALIKCDALMSVGADALEAQALEIERLRKDAERYQFLRYCDLDDMAQEYWPGGDVPTGEALDSAIDAAMKNKGHP